MSTIKTVFSLFDSEDPDVLITTPYQQFTLHSKMLKLCSRWFAASMSKEWWTGAAVDGDTISYRYVLNFDKDAVSTLLPEHQPFPPGNIPEAKEVKELCEAFRVMFKCFYRQPIKLYTFDKCSKLVALADQYDSLGSIVDSIRASFFEWPGIDIDVEIKNNPTAFLMLGYRLQSARIFKEAFIHIVGLNVGQPARITIWSEANNIPKHIVQLVRSESYRLSRIVTNTIRRYMVLGTGIVHPEDGGYGQAVFTIMKHKLVEYCTKFGGPGFEGLLFRGIAQDPFAVTATDLALYGRLCDIPRSQSAHARIIPRIKDVALVLAKNNLRLKEEMRYLTCAVISGDDLPTWLNSN